MRESFTEWLKKKPERTAEQEARLKALMDSFKKQKKTEKLRGDLKKEQPDTDIWD